MLVNRCFACDKPLRNDGRGALVVTNDCAQTVIVGPECFRKIKQGAAEGYQPLKGGPRLFTIKWRKPEDSEIEFRGLTQS